MFLLTVLQYAILLSAAPWRLMRGLSVTSSFPAALSRSRAGLVGKKPASVLLSGMDYEPTLLIDTIRMQSDVGCDRCRKRAEVLRQHWLLLSLHWATCSAGSCGGGDACAGDAACGVGEACGDGWPYGHSSCDFGWHLWAHIEQCKGGTCGNPM